MPHTAGSLYVVVVVIVAVDVVLVTVNVVVVEVVDVVTAGMQVLHMAGQLFLVSSPRNPWLSHKEASPQTSGSSRLPLQRSQVSQCTRQRAATAATEQFVWALAHSRASFLPLQYNVRSSGTVVSVVLVVTVDVVVVVLELVDVLVDVLVVSVVVDDVTVVVSCPHVYDITAFSLQASHMTGQFFLVKSARNPVLTHSDLSMHASGGSVTPSHALDKGHPYFATVLHVSGHCMDHALARGPLFLSASSHHF